jgi:carboxyl-terminal processing protease
MKYLRPRFAFPVVLLFTVCLACGLYGPYQAAKADNTVSGPAAQLESQAADAIRLGHFDRGTELLNQAAKVDGGAGQLATWANEFEAGQVTFAKQRQDQYEKNVKDIHTLLDHGMGLYAIDAVQQAYLRVSDKTAFRNEKWVDDLVKNAAADATKAEADEKWLTALRIYSDLTSVDPSEPQWKKELKKVTLNIRLQMLYTPDAFKEIQKTELASRKAADALLHPSTQPTTEPVADDDNTDFKTDWHDAVRGITFDMLLDSLVYAEHDYYRPAPMASLMNGGIESLRAITNAKGLQAAFPNLADESKKKDFLWALDEASAKVKAMTADTEDATVHDVLIALVTSDHDTIGLPQEVFVSEFADGALDTLDPFSNIIWPYDMPEFLQMTRGEFTGVGIQIENAEDGSLKVVTPVSTESPAYQAGIRAGDIITKIDGKNAHGITTNQAVKNITGPAHTIVALTIKSPDGKIKVDNIERAVIRADSVKGYVREPGGSWEYFIDPANKIGYLQLTGFTSDSTAEFTRAMDSLNAEGVRGLVLDLRYNPGGLLNTAVEIASKFIRSGVIVSTHPDRETENKPTVEDARPDRQTTDMPLVVLVNQYSASASEILSGALKDHNRATIVGERTFGKGSVQMPLALSAKTALLKLTIAHYYLPSGRCLHRDENSTVWGVDPDVPVEMTPEQMRAAIDARQEMEVLHEVGEVLPTTRPDEMAADPQLSAGLLVLRMKLAGVGL